MKLYNINEISIPENRHRQYFDPKRLEDLTESIIQQGLFHAPLVRETPSGPELVAGERRLRALVGLYEFGVKIRYDNRLIPLDMIPTVTRGEVDYLTAREAELRENIDREDLTWQEKEMALAELHEMRVYVAEAAGQKHTFLATAQEVKGDEPANAYEQTLVRRATIIAKHMKDPEVAKAPDASSALKIIEKKINREYNLKRAEEIGKQASSSRHMLLNGDSREELKQLQLGFFDCILMDPPYGIRADGFGDMAEGDHEYADDPEYVFNELLPTVFSLCYAKARPQAHLYSFCDPRHFHRLFTILAIAGWDAWPVPLIWYKRNGMLPRPEHGPRRCYEAIIFANKGDRKVTGVYSDVIECKPVDVRRHAAQKPVALLTNLLIRSCKPGDRILDPFCGSGSIFAAANMTALYATGIELNRAQYAVASTRLETKGD